MDGLRGEDSIAKLRRRDGILQGLCYKWSKDFMERLAFACCGRWALVIEILIAAFTHCRIVGEKVFSIQIISLAHAITYWGPLGYSPFSMLNYRNSLDQDKHMEALDRAK